MGREVDMSKGPDERAILVVSHDEDQRQAIGSWLMNAGFLALMCPGPLGPDYTCLGGRGLPCPLAGGAGIVVLDMRLGSDVALTGSPGWQLLFYYLERGKRVVALTGDEDPIHPRNDEQVAVLRRPAGRAALLDAVRALSRPRPAAHAGSSAGVRYRGSSCGARGTRQPPRAARPRAS